jgi:hypothetical protein
MRVVRILLLLAMVPAVHAQPPEEPSLSADADLRLPGLPYSLRLEAGISPLFALSPAPRSSVLTPDYWLRAYDERKQLETRFGIHLADPALRPYLVQQSPVPGHPQFNFVQELRWPGAPLTGLQFERRNLLFEGDRLTIRATSDLQTLFRGAGLSGSETELDLLSLLGWRAHSRLVWQLGEPTHEWQWQFSAGMDRHAATGTSSLALQVLRRF